MLKLSKMLLIGGIVMALVGCAAEAPELAAATPTPIPVSVIPDKPTYAVQRGDVVEVLEFNGRVAPVTAKDLFFRTDGRSRNIYFDEGETVTAGQVIADLEVLADLERQLAAHQLALRRAELQVSNAASALALYQLSLPAPDLVTALAQQNLTAAEQAVAAAEQAVWKTQTVAGEANIDAAHAQVILAQNALARAQQNYEPYANKPEDNLRRAQLKSALSAAQQQYDRAVANYNALTGTGSASEQARAAADLAVAQAQFAAAQAEWERVQVDPVPLGYPEERQQQENQLELAQIALAEAQLSVTDLEQAIAAATLVAPFDGEILRINFLEGRPVTAYTPLVVVADLSALEISADLTLEELEGVEAGMPVVAEFVTTPGTPLTGVVRQLPYLSGDDLGLDEADQTTRITLDTSLEELGAKVGDLMRLTITLDQKADVLWLPPRAIRTFDGRQFVVVQEGDYQQRVDVKLGIEGADRIEILEGLTAGQMVISP